MSLHVLVAPSGFKESLDATEVADCIEAGIRRVLPDAEVRKAPLVDGGEGFARALVAATGGSLHEVPVLGPTGRPVLAHYGFLGGPGPRTAVLEMAAAAGLRLVPPDARNPLIATTYGVGQLMRAALDAGAERILVGCGDSGTNDGGIGMAQALGVRFLDTAGRELGFGAAALHALERIDHSRLDPRLAWIPVDVACNPHNVLCGPNGVARVFGPQKGASPEAVERLAAAMDHYAAVIQRQLGLTVDELPGSGASGGLGTGLLCFAGATLHPRYDVVMRYLELDTLLADCDLVFTAEGGIDSQTPRGKIPAEVARRARPYGVPVVALAGTIGCDAPVNLEHGIASYFSILQVPCTLGEAIAAAPELLADCAERVMRLILVGSRLDRPSIGDADRSDNRRRRQRDNLSPGGPRRPPGPCWQHRGTSLPHISGERTPWAYGSTATRRRATGTSVKEDLGDVDILSLASGIGEGAARYVSSRTWRRLNQCWTRVHCGVLATIARGLLKLKGYFHDKVAEAVEKELRDHQRPKIVTHLVRELAERVPLPIDDELMGLARTLQMIGIYLCLISKRSIVKNCPCFKDLVQELTKDIAEAEVKQQLIDLDKRIAKDWV